MNHVKVLAAIEYRDAYGDAIRPHLLDYFDEALFAALFAILREERAPVSGMRRAEGPRSAYDNGASWEPFPREMSTLGVPRRIMPQVSEGEREAVVAHLDALGVGSERAKVRASSLRPTQDEWSPAKVEAALGRKGRRPILVSGDNRVVDGHHQWLAAVFSAGDAEVEVVRFFAPTRAVLDLMATFPGVDRDNSAGESPLERALDRGDVWYADGVFSGRFSADVARQLREAGAAFDERTHVFRLSIDQLAPDVRLAASESLARSERAHDRVQAYLTEAQRNFARAATGIDVDLAVGRITDDLAHQFNASVNGLDWITVQPEVDPATRKALAKELTENLDLDVKSFLAEEIPELRRMVEENVFDGMRGDKLADIIAERYGVTRRKAAFLAFQETSLLVSNYREQQALAIGSLSYVWSTSRDERVRKDHKNLNGRTFFWGDPPVTNERTGAHNNPGEDFGCRCAARPIVTVPASFEVLNSRRSPIVSRCNAPSRSVVEIP